LAVRSHLLWEEVNHSPTPERTKMRHVGRLALTAALVTLAACSESSPVGTAREGLLLVNFLTPATVRTVVVEVEGPGISPSIIVNIPIGADSTARDTLTLTAGSGRHITVTALDSAGVITHRGDTTVTIVGGQNTPLALVLRPVEATLGITVTFGGITVSLDDSAARVLLVGDTVRAIATARTASGAQVSADSLVWASSNPAIATVGGGLVSAVRPGTATLVVSLRGASARFAVNVGPRLEPDIVLVSDASRLWLLDITDRSQPRVLHSQPGAVREADLHPDLDRAIYRNIGNNEGVEISLSTGVSDATGLTSWYPQYSAGGDSVIAGFFLNVLRPARSSTDISPCGNGYARWVENDSAFLCGGFELFFRSIATNAVTAIPILREPTWVSNEWLNCPSLSPDGTTIAFHIELGPPVNQKYLVDRNGSNLRAIGSAGSFGCLGAWSPREQTFASINGSAIQLHDKSGTLIQSIALPSVVTAVNVARWR